LNGTVCNIFHIAARVPSELNDETQTILYDLWMVLEKKIKLMGQFMSLFPRLQWTWGQGVVSENTSQFKVH
jgi:hypothetical protein